MEMLATVEGKNGLVHIDPANELFNERWKSALMHAEKVWNNKNCRFQSLFIAFKGAIYL